MSTTETPRPTMRGTVDHTAALERELMDVKHRLSERDDELTAVRVKLSQKLVECERLAKANEYLQQHKQRLDATRTRLAESSHAQADRIRSLEQALHEQSDRLEQQRVQLIEAERGLCRAQALGPAARELVSLLLDRLERKEA